LVVPDQNEELLAMWVTTATSSENILQRGVSGRSFKGHGEGEGRGGPELACETQGFSPQI
jgi:predicted metalloenzyme YecM